MSRKDAVVWFAGGGLACIGMKQAGYTPVWAVEFDPAIAGVYAANHGAHVSVKAVQDVTRDEMLPYAGCALFQVSPSCKQASKANSQRGETEGDLSAADAICLAVETMRPERFLLENVEGYAAFESFRRILLALSRCGYAINYHVCNSADYGTPQTRRRLILAAVRRDLCPYAGWLPPLPEATHGRGGGAQMGGLFGDGEIPGAFPWVGWLESLTAPEWGEDLLPLLPDSQFAKWQLDRLPAELKSCLVHPNDMRAMPTREENEPAFTVTLGGIDAPGRSSGGFRPRAFLVGDQYAQPSGTPDRTVAVAMPEQPSPVVLSRQTGGTAPRAYLVESQGIGSWQDAPTMREGDEPAFTARCYDERHPAPRAILVEGDAAGERCPTLRVGQEPCFTVKAAEGGRVHRAVLVSNAATEYSDGTRDGERPALTVTPEQCGRLRAAVMVGGGSASGATVPVAPSEEPAITIKANAGSREPVRASFHGGRVVKMTARALLRFMGVRDSDGYRLPDNDKLAATVCGNGVPPQMVRAHLEVLP